MKYKKKRLKIEKNGQCFLYKYGGKCMTESRFAVTK